MSDERVCPFCGRPDCSGAFVESPVMEGFPAINALMDAIISSGSLGPIGRSLFGKGSFDLIGLPTNRPGTTLSINEAGQLSRHREGTRTELKPMKEIPEITAPMLKAYADYRVTYLEIEQKQSEAEQLQAEAKQSNADTAERLVELRFAISQILPPEHYNLYGNKHMQLIDDEGKLFLIVSGNDRSRFEIGDIDGWPLLTEQDKIKSEQLQASQKLEQAARLFQQVAALPDLLEIRQKAIDRILTEVIDPLYTSDPDLDGLGAGFDTDGEPVVIIRRSFTEDSDQIPPEELELFRAAVKLQLARNANLVLAPEVLKALDLPVQQIEASDTTGDQQDGPPEVVIKTT